uniref:Smr domain-containing protein n=1 Tax=Bracon brevicornis TaxID=1563983 RepID=A0A6V7L1S7_9HYME
MASNDKWPPVAETAGRNFGKNRSNNNIKKSTKENQQQVLSILLEMFQNNLEEDIIHSVADNCNWHLQSSVDALIGLSSSADVHNATNSNDLDVAAEMQLKLMQDAPERVCRSERIPGKNRMDSFIDNISKLNSTCKGKQQPSTNFESIWDWPSSTIHSSNDASKAHNVKESNTHLVHSQSNSWKDHERASNMGVESELCGLKVQYRSTRSTPEDDDDADVVIEEEIPEKISTPIPINVSQFLSIPSRTTSKVVQSKHNVQTISTPSPPMTPKKKAHQRKLEQIGATIRGGNKILILLRGLPGSGKSHLSRQLIANNVSDPCPDNFTFSTDDYFIKLGRGVYQFDARKLEEAHVFNQTRVFTAMRKGLTPIIIDNTNTQAWEMRPYAAKAVEYGYIVETLEPNTPWAFNPKELAKKNVHGVPRNKIEAMLDRFEHGITGEKLLARFSLKYTTSPYTIVERNDKIIEASSANRLSANNDNNNTNNQQIVKISNESDEQHSNHTSAFADYSREPDNSNESDAQALLMAEKETIVNENCREDNALCQDFGPVGSERRNSLATTNTPNSLLPESESLICDQNQGKNNNQVCQSWDFPLLMNGNVAHTSDELAIRPLDLAEIQEQDEEFGKHKNMIGVSIDEPKAVQLNQKDFIKRTEMTGDASISVNKGEEYNDKISQTVKLDNIQSNEDAEDNLIIPDISQRVLGNLLNIVKSAISGIPICEKSTEETAFLNESDEIKEEKEKNMDVVKCSIAQEENTINCTNTSVETVASLSNDNVDATDDDIERNEEENLFMSTLENLQNSSITKKLVDCKKLTKSSENSNVDNINCISWKESPFPVDDLVLPNFENDISIDDVPKVDASTNTSYYDWNILYIGDTSDPSYKIIQARNRSINDNITLPKCERPPRKLMLDKSSMTGDIFTQDGHNEISNEEENKNRIPELMELFPHVPREYLIDIFEKVQENFDWAVELLLEGIPEGIPDTLNLAPKESSISYEKTCSKVLPNDTPQNAYLLTSDKRNDTSVKNFNFGEFEEKLEINDILYQDNVNETIGEETFDDTASTSTTSVSRLESIDDEKTSDNDEIIELNVGFECIKALEEKFGNIDIPEGFSPIIHIKKSLAEELYAGWIESIHEQANVRDEQLQEMIAKDAELARSLERKMELEQAEAPIQQSMVPNMEQIMDMELALAKYKNELKAEAARETPGDMAARLSFQMLHEAIPDIDLDAFNEILRAHNGNFKEAFEVIELNTGRVIAPKDTLKKQKLLMDKVKEENQNFNGKRLQQSSVVRTENKDDKLKHVKDAREEAQRQLSLKIQNCKKAVEAYRRGCPSVAGYYSEVSRLHSRNMEEASAEAARAYVEAISYDNDDTLDLHNLSVSEALIALDQFIEYRINKLIKSNKRFVKLYIITGRGARSTNGVSKLKPAVSQKLTSKNIKFSELNPGCLKITLHRKNLSKVK